MLQETEIVILLLLLELRHDQFMTAVSFPSVQPLSQPGVLQHPSQLGACETAGTPKDCQFVLLCFLHLRKISAGYMRSGAGILSGVEVAFIDSVSVF